MIVITYYFVKKIGEQPKKEEEKKRDDTCRVASGCAKRTQLLLLLLLLPLLLSNRNSSSEWQPGNPLKTSCMPWDSTSKTLLKNLVALYTPPTHTIARAGEHDPKSLAGLDLNMDIVLAAINNQQPTTLVRAMQDRIKYPRFCRVNPSSCISCLMTLYPWTFSTHGSCCRIAGPTQHQVCGAEA